MIESKECTYNQLYIDIAHRVAKMSHCTRMQVGAIAVKNDRIVSMGWNGQPSGFVNKCEDVNNVTQDSVIHAESNLITKMAKSNDSIEGASIYVTHGPCIQCAKLIYQSGVKEVFYTIGYKTSDGIELLVNRGIQVCKLTQQHKG